MPRTQDEITAAAAALEKYLEDLDAGRVDPDLQPVSPELRELGRAVLEHARAGEAVDDAVAAAHVAGHSWTEIGNLLGVSRQTAHQRYASRMTS